MKNKSLTNSLSINNTSLLFCILSAFVFITICSKSSPLYSFNDWVDANCYFTVGKSIFKGLVPYKDLFEQKGPVIYFIHALASLISYRTFFGVYLFEVLIAFAFLYLVYKTLELFCGKNAFYIVPLVALIIYTSPAFCQGDSAEELCLPLLMYTVYIALKSVIQKNDITNKEFLLTGIFAACVFWTKFSLCGIYPGWFIPFAIYTLINKKYDQLLKSILFIALGLLAGTLPWIIYFGFNHALKDLFTVYIYENIFFYARFESSHHSILTKVVSRILSLVAGFGKFCHTFPIGLLLLITGGFYFYFRKWQKELIYIISMFLFAFFFIYIGGRRYAYYGLGLAPFVCLGFIPFFLVFSSDNEKYKLFSRKTYLLYFVFVFIGFFLTDNRYMMKLRAKQDKLPQYKFAKIIAQTPGATLLNFDCLDMGLYTTTGIIPNCKAFCGLNIHLKGQEDLQGKYIREGLCDYIVTFRNDLSAIDINNLYEIVDRAETPTDVEGNVNTYFLYRIKTRK